MLNNAAMPKHWARLEASTSTQSSQVANLQASSSKPKQPQMKSTKVQTLSTGHVIEHLAVKTYIMSTHQIATAAQWIDYFTLYIRKNILNSIVTFLFGLRKKKKKQVEKI